MLNFRLPIPRLLTPSEILVGVGSFKSLRVLGANRVCIIHSGSVLQDPQQVKIIGNTFSFCGLDFIEAPKGEPKFSSAQILASKLQKLKPDWIIGLGGGSTLDYSKLAWVLYENPDLEIEFLKRPFAIPRLRGKARLIACPTTAGTGSEVSSSALVVDDSPTGKDHKVAVVSHELIPDLVVLDPFFMRTIPTEILVAASLDAWTHSMEGYVSKYQNSLLNPLAESALRLIEVNLPIAQNNPENLEAKEKLLIAALYSGWVQNYKVPGIAHAFGHGLGASGVPHGLAVSAFLVPAMRFNVRQSSVENEYRNLAVSLAWGNSAHAAIDKTLELQEKVKFNIFLKKYKKNLENIGATIEEISKSIAIDPCFRANPCTLDPHDIPGFFLETISSHLEAKNV